MKVSEQVRLFQWEEFLSVSLLEAINDIVVDVSHLSLLLVAREPGKHGCSVTMLATKEGGATGFIMYVCVSLAN